MVKSIKVPSRKNVMIHKGNDETVRPSSDKELTDALSKVRKSIEEQGLDKPETKEIPMSEATATTATRKKVVIKKKATAAAPAKAEKTSRAEGFTAGDMAKEVGVDSATLRKALRGAKVKKPAASWTWPSKSAASEAISKVKAFLKDAPTKKK